MAYKRVVASRGAAGVNGISVDELSPYLHREWERIKVELLAGQFEPPPVRVVEIPRPGGRVPVLGIPTVVDRLVQRALLQILTPVFDPTSSVSSFGLRPGRDLLGTYPTYRGLMAFAMELELAHESFIQT